MERAAWKYTQGHMSDRQPGAVCCLTQELRLGLYDDLQGWDGSEVGREGQEGGDVYTPMTDSY